jgi:hypothetical protein
MSRRIISAHEMLAEPAIRKLALSGRRRGRRAWPPDILARFTPRTRPKPAVTGARRARRTINGKPVSDLNDAEAHIYIWLLTDPLAGPAEVTIPDVPGINDNDQIADAIRGGLLGRYLPVTLKFAAHPTPTAKRVRSLDVARLLNERHIRFRRRYEVLTERDESAE